MSRYGEPCGGIHGYVRLEENRRPLAKLRVESVSGSATVRWRTGAGRPIAEAQGSGLVGEMGWLALFSQED